MARPSRESISAAVNAALGVGAAVWVWLFIIMSVLGFEPLLPFGSVAFPLACFWFAWNLDLLFKK